MTHNPKELSGRHAAELAESGMTLGLGTGSTVYFTLVRLAERIRDEGLDVRGVPTSVDTETKAREMGIPLVGLDEVDFLDLTIDGADEIDGEFHMIKGGGGALLREKVVASITQRQVIVVGRDKVVERLGLGFLLPVEVAPFAQPTVERALARLGCTPRMRLGEQGAPFVTDNANRILDCKFADGILDPRRLEQDIDRIPGVVESGLFIDLAHVCVIGEADGTVEVREKRG
ncbi:MAG: ribose-5-phosphate isomerase RpiA [Planctomycetes bacterium]|nr:ribose-5-phosphate isomerase RpiA [Planctomycetota bacterium]